MVGRAGDSAGTLATLRSLGRGGRLVLMGSMTVPLHLDYGEVMQSGWEILGNFMYPRDALARLLGLLDAGLLALDRIPRRTFPLADLPDAMQAAAARNAPLIVITN
jgi:alcohol dehydrogenase